MTRRIISAALIVLGVVAIALAIASATVWRPAEQATLTVPSRPEAPVVISEAGVLDAVDPEVTVRATAGADQPVTLAVGRTSDVLAWVGDAPHTSITGLSSWQELTVEEREATPEEPAEDTPEEPAEDAPEEPADEAPAAEEPQTAAVPDPAGSDLWVAEQTGTGQVELDWQHTDGRWSLLAVTDGEAAAPEVALTWPVESRTPWLVPGLVLGAILLVAGLALLVLDLLVTREGARRRSLGPERAEAQARNDASETDVLTTVGTPAAGLTRRELRERGRDEPTERRDEGVVEQAGPARGAGIVPAASDTDRHRTEAPETEGTPDGALGAWFDREGGGSDPAKGTAPAENNGSSLERAADQFEESTDSEEHPPAERVEAPHGLLPDEEEHTGAAGTAGPERTGFLGFLRRRRHGTRNEPGILPASGSDAERGDAEPGTTDPGTADPGTGAAGGAVRTEQPAAGTRADEAAVPEEAADPAEPADASGTDDGPRATEWRNLWGFAGSSGTSDAGAPAAADDPTDDDKERR